MHNFIIKKRYATFNIQFITLNQNEKKKQKKINNQLTNPKYNSSNSSQTKQKIKSHSLFCRKRAELGKIKQIFSAFYNDNKIILLLLIYYNYYYFYFYYCYYNCICMCVYNNSRQRLKVVAKVCWTSKQSFITFVSAQNKGLKNECLFTIF